MEKEFELTGIRNVSLGGISLKEEVILLGRSLAAYSFAHNTSDKPLWLHEGGETVSHLSVSHDERSMAATTSNLLKLIDVSSGRESRRLVDHNNSVTCVSSLSRSPYQWISGDEDGVCRISDARRHPSTLMSLRSSRPVRCVQSSPDDSLLLIGDDVCLQLYDLRQRKLLTRFVHSTVGVAFNPGERLMASFGDEGVIRYWDLDTLECVSQSEPYHESILTAHFSYKGDSLIVCSNEKVRSLSWEPCTLEWQYDISCTSRLLTSNLDRNDHLRLLIYERLTDSVELMGSSLYSLQEQPKDIVIDSPSSSSNLPSPLNDEVFVSAPVLEERSLRIVSSTPPPIQQSQQINKCNLNNKVSRMALDDSSKKKFEDRRNSVKKNDKTSIDIMSMIDMEHGSIMEELNGSWQAFRCLRDTCKRGGVNEALESISKNSRKGIIGSICRECNRNGWTLSTTLCALPHISLLLSSNERDIRAIALSTLSTILTSLADLVSTMTKNGAPTHIGVDVAAEERLRICNEIKKELILIQLRENDMLKVMKDDEQIQLSAVFALFPD